MREPGLDGRHRDADGTIDRKRNDTQVGTLRQTYGPGFAPGFADRDTLGDVLGRSGDDSLSAYLRRGGNR